MEDNEAGSGDGSQTFGYTDEQRKEDNERSMRFTALHTANKPEMTADEILVDAEKFLKFLKGEAA